MPASWIDTHCHLDAAEFDADRPAVLQRAWAAGLGQIVLPAVEAANFAVVRDLAHAHGLCYGLGIHPLYVDRATEQDLQHLRQLLHDWRDDPRLVAVGEIGLDQFVKQPALERQERFYAAQLQLAREAGLPVLLHCRKSADLLLKGLRRTGLRGGIVHAFNGSRPQADAFLGLGFALGFGGAMTFERALQIRRLAAELPAEAWVLETDAPDIPPQWLYLTAQQRADGARSRNEPAQLPRIAQAMAALRGLPLDEVARLNAANAARVLPRLAALAAPAEPGAHGTEDRA